MATKRGNSKGRNGAAKKKKPGNVTLGPIVKKTVRVPINAAIYAKKESQLAQLEVKIRKLRAAIKPTQDQIRLHRDEIQELTTDIEENTEEREIAVREEFHWNTNEVRVLDAKTKKELERRTMSKEERNRTNDIEDEDLDDTASAGPADAGDIDTDDEADGETGEPEERAEQ